MTIKPWSISTAVRNPERLRDFLIIIQEIEGKENNKEVQAKFQTLLIQFKKYRPMKVGGAWVENYENPEYVFTFEEAEEIGKLQNYEGGLEMRGRQSMSPLKELGFIFIDDDEKIQISSAGKEFIQEGYSLERIFLKGLLRWQYPNPLNGSYKGPIFDINPLIATIRFIQEVNRLSNNPKGISKDEFDIFICTLINFSDIENQAKRLIDYRIRSGDFKGQELEEFRIKFREDFAREFYQDAFITSKSEKYKNLRDYGDNIRRYFRLTKLFYRRGNGNYIDIEPRREREINLLLENYDGSAIVFDDKASYIKYLTDDSFSLPWETKENLISIVKGITQDIEANFNKLELEIKDYHNFDTEQLSDYIDHLRDFMAEQQRIKDKDESQAISSIDDYIMRFENLYSSKKKLSIELERLATLGLNAINDAIDIKPNYPVGDDGEPTFTAPGGVADIECYYEDFAGICEVTMLKNRSQWFNEGQPVMRHLRDFEDKIDKASYCIFIAPSIHRDTANTFYISNKHGYEGNKQRIIPLTIKQFMSILSTVRDLKERGNDLTHRDFRGFLDGVIDYCNSVDSIEWVKNIDSQLESWSKNLLG